jgi:hypothetical protein
MADLQAARADGGTKKISLKRATVDMAVVQVAETESVSVIVRLGDVGFESSYYTVRGEGQLCIYAWVKGWGKPVT